MNLPVFPWPNHAVQALVVDLPVPLEQLPPLVRAVADWLPLANAVALVRPLVMDQWPSNALHHGGVLLAYALVSFWLALGLTRKRFGQ
jgi:lipooligosaccharide transport system permease protein